MNQPSTNRNQKQKDAMMNSGLSTPTPDDRNRAIVMGSGIAGLAAARILSDFYRDVLLLEQDRIENVVEHRRGVPQSRHTHGLLASGRNALERLFPGLSDELFESGAVKCCITRDAHWCFHGTEHVQFESDLEGLLASRPLIEGLVRERLRLIANVSLSNGCRAEGLSTSSDNSRVTGVLIHGQTIPADLVVDATGRGSHSPQWLDSMGYGMPRQERVTLNIAYVTRRFRRLSHHMNGALLASIPATCETRSGGVLLAQEEDTWIATLTSYGGQVPAELPAFIDFAKALPASYIYDVVSQAKPVDEPWSARFPTGVRTFYEQMRQFPSGYVIIGDAIASFDPVYAQGMSIAALEALELQNALLCGAGNLAQRFFSQAAKVIDTPWRMTAGNPLRAPGVDDRQTAIARFFDWYVAQLHLTARSDPRVSVAFQNVKNLLAPTRSMFASSIASRVLWYAWCRYAARNRASRLEATARGAF